MRTIILLISVNGVTKPAMFSANHIMYVTPINNLNTPRCILALDDGSMLTVEDTYDNVAGILRDTLCT